MSASLEQQHWAFKLAPYLTGKAQQAYAALSSEEAANYTKLKEAILHRCNVTVDSYRQQFRATFKKPGESYQELVMRLGQLARKSLEVAKRLYNSRGNSRPSNPGTAIEYPPKRYVYLCQRKKAKIQPGSQYVSR